jgi:hypothetical protein
MLLRNSALTVLLALAALVGPAAPAWADFTAEEQESVLALKNASQMVSAGLRDYAVGPLLDRLPASSRPALAEGLRSGFNAQRELNDAHAALLNVITAQTNTPTFAAWQIQPRSYFITYAWWRMDRAAWMLQDARRIFAAIQASTSDPVLRDAARRVSAISLAQALAAMQRVDRTLAYAAPNPTSFPQVVGPHGDYAGAQWKMWRSQWYLHDALDNWLGAYTAETLPSYVGLGEPARRLLLVNDILLNGMTLLAGATWTSDQVTEGGFFRALDVLDWLTSQEYAPKHWMETMSGVIVWVDASSGHPGIRANVKGMMQRVVDGWKHSDEAAWRLMTFLDCAKLRNPVGCGGR